jgi:hypothetical protein
MSSDGENTMTGRYAGLVTRMVACAENPVLRIWCPPHQIDLVVKSSSNGIAGGTWVAFAWSVSVFLRAQAHLITSMGAKCPKKTNRWTHLGRLLTFFNLNRRKLVEFTTTNRPEQTLTSAWWVTTFAVSPAIDAVNFTFVILQSQSLLILPQAEHIHALIATLTTMFGVEMEEDAIDDDVAYESFASLRIPVDAIALHIKDQGSFAITSYDDLGAADKTAVVNEIASYATSLITGLLGVKAERDDANVALDGSAACASRSAREHLTWRVRPGRVGAVPHPHCPVLEARAHRPDRGRPPRPPQPLCLRPAAARRHRPARQHYVIRVGVGLRPRSIRSSARVLWGLGDRVCQHDVGRERLFHPQVGDGRIPHLVDASIAGGRVPIEADGPSAVRIHVIQILHCSSL